MSSDSGMSSGEKDGQWPNCRQQSTLRRCSHRMLRKQVFHGVIFQSDTENGTVFGGGLTDGLNETFGVTLLRLLTSQVSWSFNWIPPR